MWKLKNITRHKPDRQTARPPPVQRPLCLVSFADPDAADRFGPAIRALAAQCDLLVAAPPEVDAAATVGGSAGTTACLDATDWTDSAAFARHIAGADLSRYPFVLRLPLTTKTFEGLCASQEAVTALATPEALDCLAAAFADDPTLSIIGPDLLFKPLFPDLKNNQQAVADISVAAGVALLDSDPGAFALQSFAMSSPALTRLRPVLAQYAGLLSRDRETMAYGWVSSLGTGMDLAWVGLAVATGGGLGLMRRRLDDGKIVIRTGTAQAFAQEVGRVVDPVTTLLRLSRTQPDFDLLTQEPDFDAAAYLDRNPRHIPAGYGALEHFVLFGDAAGLACGSPPDPDAYRLAMGSGIAAYDNTLCHWIVRGRAPVDIPAGKWLAAAKSRRLFDGDWCADAYPDMQTPEAAEAQYAQYPAFRRRATSRNFDPRKVPVLNDAAVLPEDRGLRGFMGHHFAGERRAYDILHTQLQIRDFKAAEARLAEIMRTYGPTGPLVAADAYLAIMAQDWDRAKRALDTVWVSHQENRFAVRHKTSLLTDYTTANAGFKTATAGRRVNLSRVCVYTTIFGDSDMLLPILGRSPGVDFICISDRAHRAPGWQVRVVEPMFASSNLSAKYFKILPHEILPDYRYSIFVDGNTLLAGDIGHLVQRYLAGNPFVMWHHPERSDVYREAVAILQSGRHRPQEILTQIQGYAGAGLPPETGLAEGSFIWRDHADDDTRDFMRAWWDEIRANSHRDQLSLGYLFWKRQYRPRALPRHLGSSRRNVFFVKLPHRNPKPRGTVRKKAPIVFIYEPSRKNSGSSIMRGEQLCQMIADALPDRDVSYSGQLHWRGRILFLTKGFMEKTPVEILQRLREQGNFLIADFVDAKPDKEKGKHVDMLAAASIAAYEHYAYAFPETPACHLTHHVDPRIGAGNDARSFEPGYIGEMVNAMWTPAITRQIASVRVNTKIRDDSWLQHLRQFNFHYAARHIRDIDGFKPFLKGFTAARCGAAILTQKTVGDAVYYLGEDYPYYVPADPDEAEILAVLDQARTQYGGPVWADALDRMAAISDRTNDRAVICEFKAMLAL